MPEDFPTCILCDESGALSPEDAAWLGLRPPFSIRRCPGCGLRWQSPRPTEEEIGEFYSEGYYRSDARQTWWSDYPQSADTVRHDPAFQPILAGWYRRQLTCLRRECMRENAGALLEIGCGSGTLLDVAVRQGWTVTGIEPNRQAAAIARQRGLSVENTTFSKFRSDRRYDAVVMAHVLEHLHDPLAALQKIRTLTTEKGRVIVEVPNQFEAARAKLKRLMSKRSNPSTVLSLHHMFFFGPAHLRTICAMAGFDARIRSFFPERIWNAKAVLGAMVDVTVSPWDQGDTLEACLAPMPGQAKTRA